jgi:hypothetical protein
MVPNSPLMLCVLRDGVPIEFVGEESLVTFPSSSRAFIRSFIDDEYCEVKNLTCTTHRLHYARGGEIQAIRLDTVISFELRGGFLKPKKLVFHIRRDIGSCEFSLRLAERDQLESLISAVSSSLQEKRWQRTGGFVLRPIMGGLSRVVARVEQVAHNQGLVLDSGLADLDSMRKCANELKDVITQLKRGGNSEELSEIDKLLSEYGLFDHDFTSLINPEQNLSSIVLSAVHSAGGVILLHDLFCLVNRKLKLERVFSPKEFLNQVSRMTSVTVMVIRAYKIVVSLNLEQVHAKLLSVLSDSTAGTSESILAGKLQISNIVVLHLLLLKVEELYGRIIRDDYLQSTSWYLNIF